MSVGHLISTKQYECALKELDILAPSVQLDIDKKVCNVSYVYYLMGQYVIARDIILDNLATHDNSLIWPRLYYRLAKAYEGLQNYEEMRDAYAKMFENLSESDKDKRLGHMQDYYNQDVNFMRQWVINSGGQIRNVAIQYYDVDYRGMTVAESIKKQEPIIQVPWSCIISLEECKKTNPYVLKLIEAGTKIHSPHSYLAMELIYLQNQKNCNKQPYLRCIPKFFDNIPINFTIDELSKLEGSYAIVKIMQKLLLLKTEYDIVNEVLSRNGGDSFSFSAFVWARTAVITRVYAIKRNGESDTVLVPFADMANHETPPNTKWQYNDKNEMFVVEAEQFLGRGDVLYETYGYKCNYRYFVNYGFTVANNKHEEAALMCNYLLKGIVENFIADVFKKNKAATIRDIFETELYPAMNTQIMKLFLSEPSIYQVSYTYNDNAQKMFNELRGQKEITRESEFALHQIIYAVASQTLAGFATSREDDEVLLREYDYDFNTRNAIIMRISEKSVLEFWIALTSGLIALFEMPKLNKKAFKQFNKKMSKWVGFKTFEPYIGQLEKIEF